MTRSFSLTAVLLLGFAGSSPAQSADSDLTFEKHVRPILKTHCFDCHGEGDKLKGGLDLRLRQLIVQGGKSGSALTPGNRDASYLYERIRSQEMPPGKKKLPASEVAVEAVTCH